MSIRLHRFFACVLLVLLPMQALAATAMCPHAKAAPTAAMEAMEHCPQATGGMDNAPSTSDGSQQSCCAGVTCAMCSALLSMALPSKSIAVHEQSNFFVPAQYVSFIPDGLQRPPAILA
ncbi:MAG: hypothetical protein JWN94_4646 [Betaproteobacteria bacterium]|nr:hypothetical protein [Betaproteobacteria bacterium]